MSRLRALWQASVNATKGGLSSASLEITDGAAGGDTSSIDVFSGKLSLDISERSTWRIRRSGFCVMRSKKFDGFIDLDAYDTIAMRIKGQRGWKVLHIYYIHRELGEFTWTTGR